MPRRMFRAPPAETVAPAGTGTLCTTTWGRASLGGAARGRPRAAQQASDRRPEVRHSPSSSSTRSGYDLLFEPLQSVGGRGVEAFRARYPVPVARRVKTVNARSGARPSASQKHRYRLRWIPGNRGRGPPPETSCGTRRWATPMSSERTRGVCLMYSRLVVPCSTHGANRPYPLPNGGMGEETRVC